MSLKANIKKIVQDRRRCRLSKLALKQKDVTILSNFCIGGAIYNDLGLQFLSPTINLFFGHHGFIDLVNNLEEYRTAELIDTGNSDNFNGKKTPVCILRKEGFPDVEIHFNHYNSYEEAREKWFSRYDRIVKDKIYLIISAVNDHDLIDEYAELPYPKVIFSNVDSDPSRNILHMKFFDKKRNKHKPITNMNMFGKKGYDEFDFVNEIFNRDYN